MIMTKKKTTAYPPWCPFLGRTFPGCRRWRWLVFKARGGPGLITTGRREPERGPVVVWWGREMVANITEEAIIIVIIIVIVIIIMGAGGSSGVAAMAGDHADTWWMGRTLPPPNPSEWNWPL